jgi:hypothetical protein
MVASITTQELEDLASGDASIGEFVGGSELEAMAGKAWDFGESLVTEKMIKNMEKEGYFSIGRAELPPTGQIVPLPLEGYAVVFWDYFLMAFIFPPLRSYARFLKNSNSRFII